MKHTLEEIKYICHLINEAHLLSVFYINPYREVVYECPTSEVHKSQYYVPLRDQIKDHAYQKERRRFPVFFSFANMHFFFIHLLEEKEFLGTIMVGPCLDSALDMDKLHFIMDMQKEFPNKRTLIEFYQSLPVVSPQQWLAISLLVYYLIYQEELDPSFVGDIHQPGDSNMNLSRLADLEISRDRGNQITHSNLAHERVLLDCVKHGRTDKIKDVLRYTIVGEDELGTLSKRSRIRSEKNLMITGIALICRAAIEGGLNEETAFTLNDFYIQQLEEQESLKEVYSITAEAVYEFTDRVAKVKEHKYSTTIIACQNYIYNHLYEEITLDQLAALSHLSPNYLSSLFKKEVGITISEYIQRQKIDEAKKLLSSTKYPISDICSWLNFNDQSYFIKVFKKFTGMTPKHFRDENIQD